MNNLTDTTAYGTIENSISKEAWIASLDSNNNLAWQALHINVHVKPSFDDLNFIDAPLPTVETPPKKLGVAAQIFLAFQILFTILA